MERERHSQPRVLWLAGIKLLLLLVCRDALAQAATEWSTPAGLPVAVVEVTGGDVEHLVALVPAGTPAPASIAGRPLVRLPQRRAESWAVEVPAAVAAAAVTELASAVAVGCTAVVALGPVPYRELAPALAALERARWIPSGLAGCLVADGGIEVERGTPERLALALAAPPPADPRSDLLPALATWLQGRLQASFAEPRVEVAVEEGCTRLFVRLAGGDEHPRLLLSHLREELGRIATATATAEELTRLSVLSARRSAELAASGRVLAIELVERLALGGRAAPALVSVAVDPAVLTSFAREILAGHAGLAHLWIAERRPLPQPPETLGNGVVLSWQWLPDELAAVAVSFGGLDLAAARAVTTALAARLARTGWSPESAELGGVFTLAIALPPAEVTDALELIADALLKPAPALPDASPVATALGLARAPVGEGIAVALALPPEEDEGLEAARKFFAALPSGGMRAGVARPHGELEWAVGEPPPRISAVVDLPPSTAGWLARELIAARLAREGYITTARAALVEGPVLTVAGEGEAHVPALDARLAAAWERATQPTSPAEVTAAAQQLFVILYGDLRRSTARAAAQPFLAGLPSAAALLAAEASEVNLALAELPPWQKLLRVASGPAPLVVVPPVRKSRPPRTPG